jgi:hypothetical protein
VYDRGRTRPLVWMITRLQSSSSSACWRPRLVAAGRPAFPTPPVTAHRTTLTTLLTTSSPNESCKAWVLGYKIWLAPWWHLATQLSCSYNFCIRITILLLRCSGGHKISNLGVQW